MYWDGGLFDNTPLSALLGLIDSGDAASTRVIVVNLFPQEGAIPRTMLDVFDRMTELQFANKTDKDVKVARKINKLVAVIEGLQGLPADDPQSVLRQPEFADLARYRVFENIIAISNTRAGAGVELGRLLDGEHRAPDRGRLSRRESGADASAASPPPTSSKPYRKSPEDPTCPSR